MAARTRGWTRGASPPYSPTASTCPCALQGRVQASSGTGTSLSCDIPDVDPMNSMIEMTARNDQPVARISDAADQTQRRDEHFVAYLKHVFRVADAQQGLPS